MKIEFQGIWGEKISLESVAMPTRERRRDIIYLLEGQVFDVPEKKITVDGRTILTGGLARRGGSS